MTYALSDDAKDWLAERGYDPAFGARPLKRMMQRHVSNGLTFESVSTAAETSESSHNGAATVGA